MNANEILALLKAMEDGNKKVYRESCGGPYARANYNLELSMFILNTLKASNKPMRVMDIQDACPDLRIYSISKLANLLKVLVAAGYVKRDEIIGDPIIVNHRTVVPTLAFFSIA